MAKRSVRWTLAVIGSLVGLVGIFVIQTIHRSRLLLREHHRSAIVILETFPPDGARRPAILEPEEEGNAWDLEEKVLSEFDSYNPKASDMSDGHRLLLAGGVYSCSLAEDSEVAEVERHLDTLRQALRRRVVLPARRPGIFTAQVTLSCSGRLISSAIRLHHEGEDLLAAERLVLAIGLAQDLSRHGDYRHWHDLVMTEHLSVWAARQILSAHTLSAGELKSWATWMDHLKNSRPPLAAIIALDSAEAQKELIEDFAGVAVYHNAVGGPYLPVTWQDLWCRTLAKSRAVLDLDRTARALSEAARKPAWARESPEYSQGDLGSCYSPDARVLDMDAESQLCLLLWRVSIAVAGFEAEHGEFPKSLGQLVPHYLPEEPISPRSGKRLEYEPGKVGADPGPAYYERITVMGGPALDVFRWDIGRSRP
jgi:hypothetical protein